MSKERIIDEVYDNYATKFEEDNSIGFKLRHKDKNGNRCYGKGNREMFIKKCKTSPEFSEEWGLKIEERELSLEERRKLAKYDSEFVSPMTVESWDRNNIPTKLITLTYNNETIESYE